MENVDKNDSKALIDRDTAAKVVAQNTDKMDRVVTLLMLGFDVPEAGEIAGYSESYSKTGLYVALKKNPQVHKLMLDKIENLPAMYKNFAKALLPQIADLERKIVDHVAGKIEDYPKFKQAIKELKQSAAVLKVEGEQNTFNLHIQELQDLAIQCHQTKGKVLDDDYKEIKDELVEEK